MPYKVRKLVRRWKIPTLIALSVTILILIIRFASWIQPLELLALDSYFQLRPLEPKDERILIVGLQDTEADKGIWPLSDTMLADLITKIEEQKPKVVGLDFYRNAPVYSGHSKLIEVFENNSNLIGIEKVGYGKDKGIAPSSILQKLNQVADVSLITDSDGVVRRAILYPNNDGVSEIQYLGLEVALLYLGISPKTAPDGHSIQIGNVIAPKLKPYDGGYVRADTGGYQILLNFRGPNHSFSSISISDVLDNKIPENIMHNRIVLIGSQAESLNDRFYTPYSKDILPTIFATQTSPPKTDGVEIVANVASQILSSVLDNRPLIIPWREPEKTLLIIFAAGLGTTLAWIYRPKKMTAKNQTIYWIKIVLSIVSIAIILFVGGYYAFLNGWWIPVVSPLLALVLSISIILVYVYADRAAKNAKSLEIEVAERTRQLKTAQAQIITQEKLASLGRLTAGIAHEIRNPLNHIVLLTGSSANFAEELNNEIDNLQDCLSENSKELIENLARNIQEDTLEVVEQTHKIVDIIELMLRHSRAGVLEKEPTDINNTISLSIELARYGFTNRFGKFDIEIRTKYDASLDLVHVVVAGISQAIINLIDNACYAIYMKKQSLPNFKGIILLKTRNLSDLVEIVIRDNGVGISKDLLEGDSCFEPFRSSKPLGKGTGLGLYIVREIVVEIHGGSIRVDSEEGEFTEFKVLLPKG